VVGEGVEAIGAGEAEGGGEVSVVVGASCMDILNRLIFFLNLTMKYNLNLNQDGSGQKQPTKL